MGLFSWLIGPGSLEPLHNAILANDVGMVQKHVEMGTDVNKPGEREGPERYPIFYACHSSPAILELLIRAGADINVSNGEGNTPLHLAAEFGRFEVVALLLRNGARVNVKNKTGHTPLKLAMAKSEIQKELRAIGATRSHMEDIGKRRVIELLESKGATL
ncbi:MAG TPA: ankyrin repeat domain-containing protein [Pirellulaceae bacterium]|jgi:ankyrin repeat protein